MRGDTLDAAINYTQKIRKLVDETKPFGLHPEWSKEFLALCDEFEVLMHKNQIMLECLKKIAEHQVDESEWGEVAENMYWIAVKCLNDLGE